VLVQQEIYYFLVILFLIFMPNLYNLSVDLSICYSLIIPIVPAYNLDRIKRLKKVIGERFRQTELFEFSNLGVSFFFVFFTYIIKS